MRVIIATAVALLIGTPVMASQDLANKNGCNACHQMNTKAIGPTFQDIAKKYKGDKEAPIKLATKVKAGGSGVWGPIPMPPNAKVTEEDAKTLVTWILSTAN